MKRNLRRQEPHYVNRHDDYLDPEFHKGDSSYLKPINCMEQNSDLDRKEMCNYMNICAGKRQDNQDPLDDYLEPRKKSCK